MYLFMIFKYYILMMISETFNEDYFAVMARYPDKHFDLACCDIPYGINVGKMAYLTEQNTFVKQNNGTKLKIKNRPKYALKEWDLKTPTQAYFDELCRISKHQIIFGVDYVDWIGLGTGRIVWDKLVAEGMSFSRILSHPAFNLKPTPQKSTHSSINL
jgi:site-specific DNA-methyltransferase (adenine-specific)